MSKGKEKVKLERNCNKRQTNMDGQQPFIWNIFLLGKTFEITILSLEKEKSCEHAILWDNLKGSKANLVGG